MLSMFRSRPARSRSVSRVLLAAGLGLASAGAARADEYWWVGPGGFWSNTSNWLSWTVPGFEPPYNDIIRIGGHPGVSNSTVFLDHDIGGGAMIYSELHISSGMTLDANNRELGTLTGLTTITDGGRIILRPSNGPNFHDMTSATMQIGSGSQIDMRQGSRLRVGDLSSSGILFGRGTVHLQGSASDGATLTNNGGITGQDSGGLVFIQESTGRMDLDGSLGNGQLSLGAPFSQLTFQGDTLTDAFTGSVFMGSGSLLTMDMSDGWIAEGGSTFNVTSAIAGAAAQIDGGHFTFLGDLNIGGSQGHLRILADASFIGPADVFLGTDDRLEFDGVTTVEGGLYTVSSGGRIDFDGQTDISHATFNLVGSTPAQGSVNFNAGTVWGGTTTINGFARQVGNASVVTPSTINATVLDMDGDGGTTWTINHSLTVNAGAIDSGSQQFDGTINMNVGAIGRLTMNLADPGASWTMAGTMNLSGLGILTTTRVAGSRMVVTGDVTMGTGIAQITADTALQGADVTIASGGTLRMLANTTVNAATSFSGPGVLANGNGGTMLLHTGVSLGQAGLANSGSLRIGESGPGVAGVDRFESSATASWGIDIGGYLAGTQHDLLVVAGAASLNGLLTVTLVGLGGGALFAPNIGDEFTILTSVGGVAGVFSNDPVTLAGGLTYEWSVLYNPNSVVLRLDNIVPAPGSAAMLLAAGVLAVRRSRRNASTSCTV